MAKHSCDNFILHNRELIAQPKMDGEKVRGKNNNLQLQWKPLEQLK